MTKWFLLLVLPLVCSIGMNGYQTYRIQEFEKIQKIMIQKDQLLSNGYNEIAINYLEKIKGNQEEIIKNQGRVEGIIAVVNNFKPDQNLHSAVWHDGYNRGENNGQLLNEVSYKSGYYKALEDINYNFSLGLILPEDPSKENKNKQLITNAGKK